MERPFQQHVPSRKDVVQLVKEYTHWVQSVVTSCLCLVFDSATLVQALLRGFLCAFSFPLAVCDLIVDGCWCEEYVHSCWIFLGHRASAFRGISQDLVFLFGKVFPLALVRVGSEASSQKPFLKCLLLARLAAPSRACTASAPSAWR